MNLTFDGSELRKLSRQLAATGKEFGKPQMKKALKGALKPLLDAARQYVPVGSRLNRSTATFTRRSGKTVWDGTYDRGGATRRDLRIRIVEGEGAEVIRGLVGVSKARGRSGFRAHLITRSTANRRTQKGANRGSTRANDFLARAEAKGTPLAISELSAVAQKIVRDALVRP